MTWLGSLQYEEKWAMYFTTDTYAKEPEGLILGFVYDAWRDNIILTQDYELLWSCISICLFIYLFACLSGLPDLPGLACLVKIFTFPTECGWSW